MKVSHIRILEYWFKDGMRHHIVRRLKFTMGDEVKAFKVLGNRIEIPEDLDEKMCQVLTYIQSRIYTGENLKKLEFVLTNSGPIVES